jgi:hypothetical protein
MEKKARSLRAQRSEPRPDQERQHEREAEQIAEEGDLERMQLARGEADAGGHARHRESREQHQERCAERRREGWHRLSFVSAQLASAGSRRHACSRNIRHLAR